MDNWIHDTDNGNKAAKKLLSEFKKREVGGEVVFKSRTLEITTYGRESQVLKYLQENDSEQLKK